jgi:hypothetical protein
VATDVDICNFALAAIGTRSSIASLTEGSTESDVCAQHYTTARDAILAGVHWNFARKQALMSVLLDATQGQATPPPWTYEYAYPPDCLQGRYVMPQLAAADSAGVPGAAPVMSVSSGPVYFIISSDTDAEGNDQQVLLTNQAQAIFVYTKRITNAGLFSPDFITAFYYYLASRICNQLTGDKGLAKQMFEIADRAARDARVSNGNEGLTIIDSVPDWIRVRGYSADWAYPPGSICYLPPTNLTLVT